MKIPYLDLARLHETIWDDLQATFERAVAHSEFIGGRPVAKFETAFASAHGRAGAAGCASGTDALVLALQTVGLQAGDEVIVPAMTFFATAQAVALAGCTPVLADVDPKTLLLDDASVDAVRTNRTTAVLPVHLYGHTVPFDQLREWREEGLVVVEDAAQAHLATWQGQTVGTVGHAACFSFYPAKNLGALGDAGALVSDDVKLLDDVRVLRDHGRSTKHRHDVLGRASRLDALQAAFLSVKLAALPVWTESRRVLAEHYRTRLEGQDAVRLVPWQSGAVHHLVVARVASRQRDEIREQLAADGVETGVHYPIALSQQPALHRFATECPVAEQATAEVISLPVDPLMTLAEVDVVCDRLIEAVGG